MGGDNNVNNAVPAFKESLSGLNPPILEIALCLYLLEFESLLYHSLAV